MVLNFLNESGNSLYFRELWFDRCIDRNGEYIPFYPFHNDLYSPVEWVNEGHKLVEDTTLIKIGGLIEYLKENGVKILSYDLFVEDSELKPTEEAGCDVVSVDEFLKSPNNEDTYDRYVYYGYSEIRFSDFSQKEKIIALLKKWE